jgi:hypothetical protein
MLAPLHAGCDIVVDHKPALTAFYRNVVGKDLDFLAALRALFDRKRWCPHIGRAGTVIEHGKIPLTNVVFPAHEPDGSDNGLEWNVSAISSTRESLLFPQGHGIMSSKDV